MKTKVEEKPKAKGGRKKKDDAVTEEIKTTETEVEKPKTKGSRKKAEEEPTEKTTTVKKAVSKKGTITPPL